MGFHIVLILANYSKVKNLNTSVNEEKEQVSIPIMVNDENGYKEFYKQYNVYIGVYYEKDSKIKNNWLKTIG